MRDQLLGNVVEEGSRRQAPSLGRRWRRLRGGDDNAFVACGGSACCCAFLFMSMFVASVNPLEWGVLRDKIQGTLVGEPVHGGIHFVAPWKGFITFPSTLVTLEFSKNYRAATTQVTTRTGADPNDPDSGGQPIGISCAVQYRLVKDKLKEIYLDFNGYSMAKAQYVRRAWNTVSVTAQEFTPQDFWTERRKISARMLEQINATLFHIGAEAAAFEITSVDFASSFETSITGVQVAQQQKVVNEYSQQVQQVEQQINVLNSHNEAYIATIKAHADKTSKEKVGNATKEAFIMKQRAKATMYAKLQSSLGFTPSQMAEYIKIRALMSQSSTGKVIVNVPPPSVAGSPAE